MKISILKYLKIYIEKFIALFIKINNKKIIIIDGTPYSGSNGYAFYKYLKTTVKYDNVDIIKLNDITISSIKSLKGIIEYCKNFVKVNKAKVILTTHGYIKKKKKQIIIEMWHGIPLKGMYLMDKTLITSEKFYGTIIHKSYNYIVSSSSFYNTIYNSCLGLDSKKYFISGFPRNDLLLSNNDKSKLEKVLGTKINNRKIVFYVPTFRVGYQNRLEGISKNDNIFGFDYFDDNRFSKYLNDNNILFIIKLHPFEENIFKNLIKDKYSSNCYLLTTETLSEYNTDLYELLSLGDMLITDYSSIYLDFILKDRPIIFVNPDIEIYRQTRGFLLEPYDFWTPGPKVNNQIDLEIQIKENLSNINIYSEERKCIKNIFHCYDDVNACKRLWELINNTLN